MALPFLRDFENLTTQQEVLKRAFDAKTAYFVNNIAELSLETQVNLVRKIVNFISILFPESRITLTL